ncbi:hypothetical protein E5672_08890 [Alteromonas portus]|uniref:Uncharacterized protein n=1 Tax=Alteromonas portus TaxID=2565549 RepID=A0A4U0ZGQ5_9ALTE|nr:hypothetical protein [Alteromonas portus]TKB03155.1 hypothetical protein E5672_08890 [Alteromonas portus]
MSSIRHTAQRVRIGYKDDVLNTVFLKNYLDGVTCVANLLLRDRDKFSVYKNAVEVLYETVCDPLVGRQWRRVCLDHLYKPLLKAECYAHNESDRIELARIKIDMNTRRPVDL